ncbi:MAG: P-type Cu+ transporter [Candidatus Atribacteria bacterium]|jgi:Cu+-exporting ATPase|nr:P-type Cu+ transporter [Candidatus Atribacteria bacterium]MDI3531445.1 P-type Cu+ transporter [Candidatus Atribacteria bacterium]
MRKNENQQARRLQIKIKGMHCSGCAASIEKTLARRSDVLKASVSFTTQTATLEVKKNANLDSIKQEIKELGYEVEDESELTKIHLRIEGMKCPSCVKGIESSLKNLEGIKEVHIELLPGTATIVFQPEKIQYSTIRDFIESLGYHVKEDQNNQPEGDQKELSKARQKLILSWVFTAPLVVLMLFKMVAGVEVAFYLGWELLLSFPVIFVVNYDSIRRAGKLILKGKTNMDTLIAVGSLAAYLSGVIRLLGKPVESFAGVGAMIVSFHLIGRFLETSSRHRATREIAALIEMKPQIAHLKKDEGEVIDVAAEELKVDDRVVIKPGEKIPQDGIIISGRTTVDESMVTGEPLPAVKQEGDFIIGGTINLEGFVEARVVRIGRESFLSQVIELVKEAQSTKVPIQAFADKVVGIFTPLVLSLALASFVVWYFLPGVLQNAVLTWSKLLPWVPPDLDPFSRALFASISTLVIACPCALGLATPMALLVGSGVGARRGILFRDGRAIQLLREIKTVFLDKTGTLTLGKPEVTEFVLNPALSPNRFWEAVYALEERSEHPLSKAIVEYMKKKGLKSDTFPKVEEFRVEPGRGVTGLVNGERIFIGNHRFFEENQPENFDLSFIEFLARAGTTVIIFTRKEFWGAFKFRDTIKEGSKESINRLKNMGKKVVLLTGDSEEAALEVAKNLGIEEIASRLLPQDKMRIIEEHQKKGKKVAMVGDGINDAPALKKADVGIAMGAGTNIAQESGDIILVRNDLRSLEEAFLLSEAIFKKIKQNLFWAFFYNLIALPLAFLGVLHPVIAEIAMGFSSLNVILNSLRLRKFTGGPVRTHSFSNWSLPAPHIGQTQSSGNSANGVLGLTPESGSPKRES